MTCRTTALCGDHVVVEGHTGMNQDETKDHERDAGPMIWHAASNDLIYSSAVSSPPAFNSVSISPNPSHFIDHVRTSKS